MLLTVVLSARAQDFEVGDLRYGTISRNEVVVIGYIGEPTDVVIPQSVVNDNVSYTVTNIMGRSFQTCESLTSVIIPNSVTSIEEGAFAMCSSLASVSISNSVTSIAEYTFAGCSSLVSVTIPNSVTSIGESAFEYCKSLASVTIPNSVTSIGKAAFDNCYSLATVTIPSSVKSIGKLAFTCESLKTIYSMSPTPPETDDSAFFSKFDDYGAPKDAIVYVPEGSKEAYSQAKGWNYFSDFREMTSNVDELSSDSDAHPKDIYNMHGTLVKANASQADIDVLDPGIYIIDGKKVIVK